MKKFEDYEVIDFIMDDSFVVWATGKFTRKDDYWSSWCMAYPHKTDVFNQAHEIVRYLKVKPQRNLTSAEVSELITKINEKNKLTETSDQRVISLHWYKQKWFKIAASLLLLITVAISANHLYHTRLAGNNSLFVNRFNETSTPILVRLPDKSSVILRSGSQLRYPKVFDAGKREVYLTGEAFFEVTKNPKRPFYVHANELVTRVLGTSFTVIAFKGDKQFKVVVNTGKVAVYRDNLPEAEAKKEGVLVIPNQQAVFYRKEEKMVKNTLPAPTMLSKEVSQKIFNFSQTPFSKVISTLNEAYGINITYNKNLANCLLTASLTDQQLYEKLDLICKAVEAKYDIVDGEITIDGKGCQNLPIIKTTN